MFVARFSSLASAVERISKDRFRRAFSSPTKTRPFKVLGVQQIAIGCAEKGPLNALWKDIFGFEAHANMRMEGENVDEDILKLGPAPFEVEVDLMTPINPEGSPKVCTRMKPWRPVDVFVLGLVGPFSFTKHKSGSCHVLL
jgi:hypothetical protein